MKSDDSGDTPQDVLFINTRVRIPLAELAYEFSRSSGAGGQNVNKNETAVALTFDLARTPALNESERARLLDKLANRVTSDGLLRMESQESRSQLKNREEVTRRFAQLLREALIVPRSRRKTKPSRAAKERRITAKKHAGEIKRGRSGGDW